MNKKHLTALLWGATILASTSPLVFASYNVDNIITEPKEDEDDMAVLQPIAVPEQEPVKMKTERVVYEPNVTQPFVTGASYSPKQYGIYLLHTGKYKHNDIKRKRYGRR